MKHNLYGRRYFVPYTGTITQAGGNADLLQINVASTATQPVRLLGMMLGQSSETGDAAEENLQLSILHMTATVTDGGGANTTVVTPVPQMIGSAASTFTARCNSATVATTNGSTAIWQYMAWNERNTPYDFWWPFDFSPAVYPGNTLIVRMDSTPADDFTGQFTFFLMEGG